ncbi:MAG: cell division protein FtsQ [Sphingomonadales bacterium]|jgi:cell division protein FtsQ|nr:cell division protein FtsQ [Sphingomonadales bacterium]MEA3035562.1 cell division protein FtsQ [Sphingomonadales bacterium]
MSAKTARGGGPRQKAKPGRKPQGRGKAVAPPSALGEAVRRVSGWIFAGLLAAIFIASLVMLRVPQALGLTAGEAAGEAGFSLKHVEIKGTRHIPQIQVYNIAFDQPSSAMALVDLEATRQRLLRFGWVRDARVSRRLPDTLVVDIVERRPAAIWQNNRQLALIDMDGVVLQPVRLDAMPALPLVIGPDANRHAGELARLVSAAPQLKPVMAGATWIGGRRWDIRFQTGETLALPEGEDEAHRALDRFARMDQNTPLLGRGFMRFDMRIPGRFVIRVSGDPGSSIPSIAPDKAPAPAAPPPPTAGAVDVTKTI